MTLGSGVGPMPRNAMRDSIEQAVADYLAQGGAAAQMLADVIESNKAITMQLAACAADLASAAKSLAASRQVAPVVNVAVPETELEAPVVNVSAPDVHVVVQEESGTVTKRVVRGADGLITEIVETRS